MVFEKEVEREKKVRELIHHALEERSEAFRDRVIRVVLRAGIDADDPIFLIVLALGSVEIMLHEIPATLERREAKLNHLVEALEAQYERFRVAADDVTTVIHDSESRIKKLITLKLPGDGNRIQSIAKIAGFGAGTFALGILLAQPIIRLSASVLCHTTDTCEEGEKMK
jgi:hypothetical protein